MQDNVSMKLTSTPFRTSQRPTGTALPRNVPASAGSTSARLAVLLALLSTLTFEIAASDGDRPAWSIGPRLLAETIFVLVLRLLARRIDRSRTIDAIRTTGTHLQHSSSPDVTSHYSLQEIATRPPMIWILSLAIVPFLVEVLIRQMTETMLPLELLLLACFRNAVLVLAGFAYRRDCQQLCCTLSTFLMIFASTLSAEIWLHGLVVIFSIVGIWWLMGTYWETLKGRLAASSQQHPSRQWLLVLPAIVFLALIGLPVAATQTHALRGFVPSSGGSDWYSEAARSGVGDGDALVAGTENIQSFGPIEDAPFLSSHEPSLYDLFDDTYDEPVKIEKQDRAISITSQSVVKQNEHHLAESRQAGKEFSTLRKNGGQRRQEMTNRNSNALLYVKGRVPLHLKLEAFDLYDGVEWFSEPIQGTQPNLQMQTIHGKPWLRLPTATSLEIYGPPETHALKIIRLDTNRIPAPTELLGVHVDQLDRGDFYKWAQPGIVCMDRDKLPSLTVLNIQSRVVDERLIPKTHMYLTGGPTSYRQFGDDRESLRVKQLAEEWTQGIKPGWPQVQMVVQRLRQEFVHDRDATAPSDCRHTVAHFLFASRRGPDYQFASAAVSLLRTLGYSSRLVSGFYADPNRYEARSQHTPVLAQDVHFWVEVCAGGKNWLPVEPTPGYQLLQPPLTMTEHIRAGLFAMWQSVLENFFIVLIGAAAFLWLILQRRFVADQFATAVWRFRPVASERVFVCRTLQLLERRLRRMGFQKSPGTTRSRWLLQTAPHSGDAERRLAIEFKRLAEWAPFAPLEAPAPVPQPREVCRRAILLWSWKNRGRIDPTVRSSGPAVNGDISGESRDATGDRVVQRSQAESRIREERTLVNDLAPQWPPDTDTPDALRSCSRTETSRLLRETSPISPGY